ncbi:MULTISPECIES: DUF2254 domain-containing protein [Mesonia]|uniref:Uncharacterized protein n=1 Tax=Mesonia oceanica TaxID=2687242 RepID=A0AC61Y622_9FLAO|nr:MULTISPECIES: DUF2254 domain-containing protein [Mesonia]MAN27221.1 hypothetical protein [Mesonia sp.]MAQ42383.1 hypothetical protein [Mesonia sp.]MBJ98671.1 hypothetical protein [Flavobacteriaceae bacterium]VVU99911.1 hypothetical protein FVB9532_01172 [Mesonia oceanica]|tara:strand:- start:114906 stop:116195 length:1290 start_codon:yes stop_codon:yes gene_type:complete
MKYLFNKFYSFFNTIEGKIAFYPTLFAFFGLIFSLISLSLENTGISDWLASIYDGFIIESGDTARTILSYLTGGLISLMVFSFSMVMVMLNQASSNYSPRVLPGLISNKNHQYVLGIYLGTIIYNVFITIAIKAPENNNIRIPSFSIFITVLLSILCLGAFIYFIHSISQSIQVNNILSNEYKKARKRLKHIIEIQKEEPELTFPNTDNWKSYKSQKTGYFQNVSINNLKELCKENELKLSILPIKGSFIAENSDIIKTNKEIDDELALKILSNFNFAEGEFVKDNYVLGFKHITEIGIRAISPAINDPSTTINTIDYLTNLLALRLLKKEDEIVILEDKQACIWLSTTCFDELLYQIILPYRTYCKNDFSCIQKLFLMFSFLLKQKTVNDNYYKAIRKEAKNLYDDVKYVLKNERDLERLEAIYGQIA